MRLSALCVYHPVIQHGGRGAGAEVTEAKMMNPGSQDLPNVEMRRRRITLEDGRYLLFYTFDDEDAADRAGDAVPPEPEAKPEAPEERRV